MSSDTLALLGKSRDHFCFPAVPAAQLKVSACRGTFASKTKLDVLPGFRNTVLRTKQVIIGCGGGFYQECTQPYSLAARWMSEVDVALKDEGQQYGNLVEASAIARVPREGLVVWCGDHKQTPQNCARAMKRELSDTSSCEDSLP